MHPDKKRNSLIASAETAVMFAKIELNRVAGEVQTTCLHTVVYQGSGNGHRICPKCGLEERGKYPGNCQTIEWWRAPHDARPEALGNSEDRLVQMLSDSDFYKSRINQ